MAWGTNDNLQYYISTLFTPNQEVPAAGVNNGSPAALNKEAIISTIGPDAHTWSKKDWRRWRKQQGLSRQEMRNIRAEAVMGTEAPGDVSRKDLKRIEQTRAQLSTPTVYTNNTANAKKNINTLNNFFANNADAIAAYNLNGTEVPIQEIEEVTLPEDTGEEPIPQVAPKQITYNWGGSNLNSYWQNQNQKVLDSLTDEQRREIAGEDGVIDYKEALAWQQGLGVGADGKFGQWTISAFNKANNTSIMTDYKNPASRVVNNGSPA